MKIFIAITVLAFAFLSIYPVLADITGSAIVTDGDSIKILDRKIRIHGIDAPEIRQSCKSRTDDEWACGVAATKFLANFLLDNSVTCEEKNIDQYGRIIAVCHVDGEDIGEFMVRSGFALAYRRYSKDYVDDEEEARKAKRGIWQGKFVEPWEWRKSQ